MKKKRHIATSTVSCRLEKHYLKQLKELSASTDHTVSWTLRRIVINALSSRSMSGGRDPKPS